MFKARQLGLRPKAFARPTERFEAPDLDRWGPAWGARCFGGACICLFWGLCIEGAGRGLAAMARGDQGRQRPPPALKPRPPFLAQPPTPKRHDVLIALDTPTKEAVLRLVDPRYRWGRAHRLHAWRRIGAAAAAAAGSGVDRG
jgi:hypothetical protein